MTQATLERPAPTEPPEPRAPRSLGWSVVVATVLVALVLGGVFPFRQMIAQHRQVDATEAKLEALSLESERLEEQVELLNTRTELERMAREDLGMVRPGETSYAVEQIPAPVDPDPVEEVSGDERSTLTRSWDFLTGKDLVPD